MRPSRPHPGLALPGIALAAALLSAPAWAQPGAVLSYQKINSATLGGLGVPLDNGDEFGDAVAALGDLDGGGPGVMALAVGAISDDDGGSHRGAVYILFLNASGGVLSRQKISATQGNFTGPLDASDELGGAITNLGDLDGAGPSVDAIAVGAAGDDDGGIDRGAIYILFLSSAGRVLSQQKISSTQGNLTVPLHDLDEFGGAVASLGDLDGAGPSAVALAVGAVYDPEGGVDRGAVHILFLDRSGVVLSDHKIGSLEPNLAGALGDNDNFGEDVSPLGDLDGAGPSVRTLAVGAVGDGDGGSHRGAVYILFLNNAGGVLSHQKISNTQGNFTGSLLNDDNFGSAVAALGDLDGPGLSAGTLAVGAGSADGLGLDRGAVFLLFLTATGMVLYHEELSSTSGNVSGLLDDGDEFGSALASLGDLDGAGGGAVTLATGVSFDDDGGTDRGATYLLSLSGGTPVGVGDHRLGPLSEGLGRARPNLFSRQTTIPFRLNQGGRVRIEIWDAGGRRVRRLVDGEAGPGGHQAWWDGTDDSGRNLPAGTYFLGMSVEGRVVADRTKAVLLR